MTSHNTSKVSKNDVASISILNECKFFFSRGWCPKFAPGLNIKICIVQKGYEWSNCPFAKMIPKWENHFGSMTAPSPQRSCFANPNKGKLVADKNKY